MSYAFQQIKHQSIVEWQIMFIVLGIMTIIIGIGTFFIIPDTPLEANFPFAVEKLTLLNHVSVNCTGIQNKNQKFLQLVQILFDPQLYLRGILTILIYVFFIPSSCQCGLFNKEITPLLVDFNILRYNNNLFCNPNSKFWLYSTHCRLFKHAIGPCFYC